MRKPLKPLLFGTISGLLIGGSVRYFDTPATASSKPSPSSSVSGGLAPANEVVVTLQPDTFPRPTLEEVLQLGGYSDAEALVCYLADASIDEVITLMGSIWKGVTDLYDLQWMVEMRGLELDPDAMQTAAKRVSNEAFKSLLTTWVKLDPIAALQADLREHSQLTAQVVHGMLTGDLDQAIAAIRAVQPDTPLLTEFENLRLANLAQNDPRAALSEVMLLADGQDRRKKISGVLEAWAEKDPLLAIQWMESHSQVPIAREHGDVMATAVAKLAKDQPELARSKLAALSPGDNRVYAEQTVMKELAARDKDAALEWVRELPSSPHRDFLFNSLLETLDEEPEKLLGLIREFGNDANYKGIGFRSKLAADSFTPQERRPGGISGISSISGITKAALEIAKNSPKDAILSLRSFGVEYPTQILNDWMAQDPEAVAKWAAGLAESEFATNLQLSLVNTWAAESPEAVATSMTAYGLSKNLDLSQALINLWVPNDAEAALVWASQLDPQVRDEVLKTTLTNVAFTDPVQALQHVNEIQDPEAQHEVLVHATRSWRIQDPEGTMTWLLTQPREAAIDDIVMSTAEEWVLSQPQPASEWISAMDPGPQKDQAVAGVVGALISKENPTKDFASAEIWAQTISDRALREQRLNDIAKAR